MHPDQLISAVSARLHLPDLAFNNEHVCRLELDGCFLLDLEQVDQGRGLQVYSVLHPHASSLQGRFAELLAANLFGAATNDATLAVDPSRDEVVLCRRFELDHLNVEWFLQQLDLFSDAVSEWARRFEAGSGDASDAFSSADDRDTAGVMRV